MASNSTTTMSKTITLTIDTTGTPVIEAHNFKGQGCAAATAALEKLLGSSARVEKKPEFHQQTVTKGYQNLNA